MSAQRIQLLFRQHAQPGASDPPAPEIERYLDRLLRAHGVVAGRPFAVNVVLGDRTPAFHRELVMCELDAATYDAEAAMVALDIDEPPPGGERADRPRFAAWTATSIGPRNDLELPGHLYLQFSAQPVSMSFDAYSDWYQVHQEENIAQSEVLRRGWRYRLEPLRTAAGPGPTHLAVYELDGTLERLTADLGSAMRAGVIGLPDWFTRFASLEAIAADARKTAVAASGPSPGRRVTGA